MFARLASVAIAALSLLPAPAPAQQSWPFNGGGLCAETILPIDWQGKPAFLLLGDTSKTTSLRNAFAWYRLVQPPLPGSRKPFVATPSFRLVAGYFEDKRTCAPGSPVIVIMEDYGIGTKLGEIGSNGTLAWSSTPGVSIYTTKQLSTDHWFAYYCDYFCRGKCNGGTAPDGPQFSALVLVME
jgi:hypothetical protein